MNKTDSIAKIAEDADLTKKSAEAALNAFIGAIETSLKKGEKVQLVGFGSFEVRKRAARKGRNPQTKEEIKIPASKAPVFKAGKAFKEAVEAAHMESWDQEYPCEGSVIEDGIRWSAVLLKDGKEYRSHGEESYVPYGHEELVRAIRICDPNNDYLF